MRNKYKTKKNIEFEIPIYFIRHAQSENNVIEEFLIESKKTNKITKKKEYNVIRNNHKSDPNLTKKGIKQCKKLGNYLKKKINQDKKIKIYTSPFKRTLDTTNNILKSLKKNDCNVIVHPEIFENGGVYTINEKNKNVGPGKCLSSLDIKQKYGYNVDLLPGKGPWYNQGWENKKNSQIRANKIIKWIKSKDFKLQNRDNIVIFVMHGDFINDLQKKLLSVKYQNIDFNINNTSISFFTLNNKKIKVNYISNDNHLHSI